MASRITASPPARSMRSTASSTVAESRRDTRAKIDSAMRRLCVVFGSDRQSSFKVALSCSETPPVVCNDSATASRYPWDDQKGERAMLLTSVLVCVALLMLLIAVPAYIGLRTHNRLVALDQRCDTAFGE